MQGGEPKGRSCSESCGFCQSHCIWLRPMQGAKLKAIELCFCEEHGDPLLADQVMPHLNFDGKTHLPAFVFACQQDELARKQPELVRKHESMIEMETVEDQFLSARPHKQGGSTQHCHVCERRYDQYSQVRRQSTQHINFHDHVRRVQKNPYNRYILELARQFKHDGCLPESRHATPQKKLLGISPALMRKYSYSKQKSQSQQTTSSECSERTVRQGNGVNPNPQMDSENDFPDYFL